MNNQNKEQTAYQIAKQKVEFRIHMITFIVINSLLVIINVTLTPGYLWFIWPLLGWTIGIILHRREVSNPPKPSFTERMIKKEMEKQKINIQ